MKLQILIPQYKETDDIIKPLLDSIALQQSVDFREIGVLICNDGSDIFLSEELLQSYPFSIRYYKEPHKGVSATRNFLLDQATAEYIMFCDADDMFSSMVGIWQIFQETENGFDCLSSAFLEEIKEKDGSVRYDIRDMDGIFIHGKVHRLAYLNDNGIRFDERLTINEDSYFTALCQSLSKNQCYISTPFYIWKWRKDSVSHQDPKYEFKAYIHMIDSNDALIKEFLRRGVRNKAEIYVMQLMADAYYTMTDPEWQENDNLVYYDAVCKRFAEWLDCYLDIWRSISIDDRADLVFRLIGGSITKGEAYNEIRSINKWIKEFGG